MEIRLITGKEWDEWDQFIKTHPKGSLYHSLEWKNILETTFGYKARFLAVRSEAGIVDGLPLYLVSMRGLGKKLICVPLCGYYPPLLSDHGPARNLLLDAAVKMAEEERVQYLEIRSDTAIPELDERNFIVRHPYYFPDLKLVDEQQNYKALLHAHKKNIATAQRNGVVVEPSRDKTNLLKFYAMMEEMYREYGTPIFAYSYLSNMWDELGSKDNFFFLLAKHDERVIGGGCFFHFKDTVTFKYGCCIKSAQPLRPYNALTWRGITLGIERGAHYFNFGATSYRDKGLLFFKKGWGAEEGKTYFYYLPIKGKPPEMEAYLDSFKLIKKIWRHLPKPVLRAIGPHFYKWIC